MGILYTIAVILIVLWLLGFVFHLFAAALGGGIHILLVIAIILFVVAILRGRAVT